MKLQLKVRVNNFKIAKALGLIRPILAAWPPRRGDRIRMLIAAVQESGIGTTQTS